jgi:RNA-directed DNA polymerase
MTLDGLEHELKARFKRRKFNLIRYTDAFIVTGDSEALLREEVTPVVAAFLAERGLRVSEEKTRIVHIEEGFDFLGQNVRKYHGKLSIKPAQKAVQKVLDHIRGMLTCHPMAKPATVIRRINPVLRGWVHDHRHVWSKQTFASVDVPIGQALTKWAQRRHPKQSKTWMKARSFASRGGHHGVLTGKEATGQAIPRIKAAAPPIQRDVNVQGHANPYGAAYEAYFEPRVAQQWASGHSGHTNATRLWQRQAGKCPSCGYRMTEDTWWHVHHVIPRVQGGPETVDNFRLLHPDRHRPLQARHSRARPAPARGL